MSLISKELGLDRPENKPLLDILNGVGRAFAVKANIEDADPGKVVLNLLLQKYAPQHLDPVMQAISGVGIAAAGAAVDKVEGIRPAPTHEQTTPTLQPAPNEPTWPGAPDETVPAIQW